MNRGPAPPCRCGCTQPHGAAAHAIVAALAVDDLDRAIELGLLGDIDCSACAPDCQTRLRQARQSRLDALAARERHRARAARLARRQAERDRQRATPRPAAAATEPAKPALPSAAAAALARARAKAAERHKP